MSQKLRNPFRMRASEKIESEANFLRLYCPHVIESLTIKYIENKLWDNILFIHSSPGAGKTSLLRIFEPQSLLVLNTRRSQEYSDLYNVLKKIDVFSETGIDLLGILHTCTRNYEVLEDLNIPEGKKKRIFFSLINARVILSTLRGMLTLKNLAFPKDLELIEFNYKDEYNYFKKISVPCNGKVLYDWALQLERDIYSLLDSFLPFENSGIEGHDELFFLEVLNPTYFSINNKPICNRILFMLDDFHKLSASQRDLMIRFSMEKRTMASIWFSERKEALSAQENLGSNNNRDYEELNIEEFWQDKPTRFEKILINIANKRAILSTENVNTFQENLADDWDEDTINDSLVRAIPKYEANLKRLALHFPKFEDWVNISISNTGNTLKKAILLKNCEILIHRNLGNSQLDLGFTLSKEELFANQDKSIDEIAKFFISREHNLPFYFGFSNLVKLSNNNIDQFLSFSADLFEEMLSNNLVGKSLVLSPESQEKKIQLIVDNRWKELPRLIPFSRLVMNFLEQFSSFARHESYKPNAPIVHGVTGIAISNLKMPSLFEESNWEKDDRYSPLVNVLSTCVAYNLLETRDIFQGKKGQKHRVFYLNRWLCMKFNLPLAYGGWKSKKIEEILKWIKG